LMEKRYRCRLKNVVQMDVKLLNVHLYDYAHAKVGVKVPWVVIIYVELE
jgi:hypothetical protein